ncbi:unnamed protein product [Auanema sp. JU1783]|nr:unnamed protein product [Auanema sp. JU1783]
MDFLAAFKEEMNKKRKQIDDLSVEVNGAKVLRVGDIMEKKEQEYLEKQKQHKVDVETTEEESDSTKSKKKKEHESTNDTPENIKPLAEIHKRLRSRGQPILLFGELEQDVRDRLLKIEIDQPELEEGWKNDLESAMKDVDNDLVKEVIEGTSGEISRHDVDIAHDTDTWDKIEHQATLLGLGDNANRDCEIIYSFFQYLLSRWGKDLNQRDAEVKKSAAGKHEASIHKQTAQHLKPLMVSLNNKFINNDIRHHLTKICRILILDRNYITANTAYMEMAIGNAPWPVGVTRSGIHQRPGSAKSYVSNIAHVLNDETQRKYIQGFKRLMTRMQEYFPTDPSKCVEYSKKQ